ncbi:MAG: bifunctional diguanylate cyclase/phosphodiesterase, partial [Oscillospiraceae bacterium]
LLGMNKSEKLSLDTILERVHQADRKELQDNILACAKNIVVSSSCEARILGSNGRYKWYMFKFKLVNYDVTGEICLAGAFYDIDDDKQKDFQIEKLAFEDDLTGIYNRHKFFNIVKETLIYAKFNNLRYAIIAINLDKFHRFNDLYGVETGDKILKAVANILRYNPYGRYCTCARLGNDEFACLIKLDEPKNDQIENYILEISSKIQDYSSFEYDDMKLTISAGACVYPDNVDDYHEVYERAVFSMRIAKADPNIIFQIYNTSIKEMIIKREILEKELQEAIDKKQFELYYQPKVDIHTEKIVGAEALIRWNHPQRGVVSPIEFIPIAEEMGIIGEIGKWTLETACTQNKLWQNSGFKPIKVSVNISSIEFYQSDIVGIVKKTLAKANLSPEWLEIELTESMALVDMEETVFKMNALRDIGVGLSMDDFGTGYSSLSYIQNLPIDELKLDKSFINKIALDDTTQNIISAIINLAKIIGLVVVAEGVEVREQFNLLKMMDCNLIQGYLFSKPVKITEIVNMMEINLIETKH